MSLLSIVFFATLFKNIRFTLYTMIESTKHCFCHCISSNGPLSHVELVDRLQKNSKVLSKNLQTVLKDLAILEVNKLKSIVPAPLYYSYHRKEAEPDFMNIFIKELGSTEIFLFLSTGDEKTVGNIVLHGNENAVKDLGNKSVYVYNGAII